MNELDKKETRTEALQACLNRMISASDYFYSGAVRTDNHAFVEFCGLINEYINICRDARDKGVDFTQANIHCASSLPFELHHVKYIHEKLECIFGAEFLKSLSNFIKST